MKKRRTTMTEKLYRNSSDRLFRKVLDIFGYEDKMEDADDPRYCTYTDTGKLLNEIHAHINTKIISHDTNR